MTRVEQAVASWHAATIDAVAGRRGRIPHALLLAGPPGIGKLCCARLIARALVCSRPDEAGRACGQCQACRLAAAGTHPDIHGIELETVEPDKQAKEIKVDQIRALCRALAQTSQFGGYKVAIVEPADRMNRNAANSLLKTLEEPAGDSVLILVSAQPLRLLPTVRSRCQIMKMRPPPREQALAWLSGHESVEDAGVLLAAAQDAPLAAAKLADSQALAQREALYRGLRELAERKADPGQAAAGWHRHADQQLFDWWLSWLQDLIALISAPGRPDLVNPDIEKDLQAVAGRIDLRQLFEVYARVQQASRLVHGSVNMQLVLESLLSDWSQVARGGRCESV